MAEMTQVAHDHPETNTGLDNRKFAMWVFLASECLFFGSLIATYFIYRGRSLVGPFPEDVYDIPFTSVSSFVLLMSSLTMVLALSAIQRGDNRGTRAWLITTATLGMIFVGGQVYEFTAFVDEGLTLSTNLFGTTFFVLTGFHGAHVTVGIIMLFTLAVRSMQGKLNALNVEMIGLYWHFVDVVWIVIFTLIYLIPD